MRINSIQNYDINNQNSKNHKNQSFKQLTITESELRDVKNLLKDKKTFNSYCKQIQYLNQFTLNLKEIMKGVKVCDYLTFDEVFPLIKPKQINKVGQEVIESFIDTIGEEKTRDFRLEIIPNGKDKHCCYQDYADNEFIGTGIACDRLCDYYKNKSEITKDIIWDETFFRPWPSYCADEYSFIEPLSTDTINYLRLPKEEKDLQEVVRGAVIQNVQYIIDNRLKAMEMQVKERNKKAEAAEISNIVGGLR